MELYTLSASLDYLFIINFLKQPVTNSGQLSACTSTAIWAEAGIPRPEVVRAVILLDFLAPPSARAHQTQRQHTGQEQSQRRGLGNS